MEPGTLIARCLFLLATVEFLLANVQAENGVSKVIAQQTRKNRMNFQRTLDNSITPEEKPPTVSPPYSFCGSAIYDQITSVEVEGRMRSCCHFVDSCSDFIESNRTKYGLENPHELRIVTCECDGMFESCLNDATYFFKDPIFETAAEYYFIENSRKCLQKLYSPSCDGPWFDEYEYEYDMNLDFYFFCPKLISSVRKP